MNAFWSSARPSPMLIGFANGARLMRFALIV
jgi:hypothetical protein